MIALIFSVITVLVFFDNLLFKEISLAPLLVFRFFEKKKLQLIQLKISSDNPQTAVLNIGAIIGPSAIGLLKIR
jgi:hypothetical protein